jgi:hypothetical protein
MSTGWRKGKCCDLAAEREVVEYDSAGNIREYCATIFVNGKKQVSSRV